MTEVALITGASSGIGKELARVHAEKGGDLVVVARSADKLKLLETELKAKHQTNIKIIVKDLSKPEAPQQVFDELQQANIRVEYLINNAGFGGRGKFHERDWETDLSMINLNVVTLTALTRLFLPGFVKRNHGRILNVSSTASLLPGPLQSVYFATKAYVTSFSNAIAEELHDTHISVTALLPGATETDFAKVSGMDQTPLFDKAFSARSVAEDGYKGMLAGKLNVLSGLTFGQKMIMKSIPFTPKKMLLGQIRKMQEVKST